MQKTRTKLNFIHKLNLTEMKGNTPGLQCKQLYIDDKQILRQTTGLK